MASSVALLLPIADLILGETVDEPLQTRPKYGH